MMLLFIVLQKWELPDAVLLFTLQQCNDVGLMAYLGTITKTCNSMNQFINKFNVLYDRQGIGRRMRGLFFWAKQRIKTSTAVYYSLFCLFLFFVFFCLFLLWLAKKQFLNQP